MKDKFKTIFHDFKMQPWYYTIILLSSILIGVLCFSFIFNLIKSFALT